MSTLQYDRQLSMLVGGQFGSSSQTATNSSAGTTTTFGDEVAALDFAKFHVVFQVNRGDVQSPNSADVRIYNVSDQTANRLQNEFSQIQIQAGYVGNFGLIFQGTVKQVRKGREDAKTTYVDITAADGDEAYNYSTIALSLAAGATPADAIQGFVQSMAQAGIRQGYIPDLSTNGSPRGEVFYGMTRDELRDFAKANNVLWSIQDGALTIVPQTSYIPGEVPVISPATGLISVPEQTQNGIEMTVLLNPLMRIGQLVKLDSSNVNQLRYGLDIQSQAYNQFLKERVKTNMDGLYYVMQANHNGDTRGNPWYTRLTCLAVDATIASDPSKGAILPSEAVIPQT